MKNGCANRRQNQVRLDYAEVLPVIDEVNEEWLRKPLLFIIQHSFSYMLLFFFFTVFIEETNNAIISLQSFAILSN